MIQIPFPGPPPIPSDIPPPGPVCLFFVCMALVLFVVEMLLMILPLGWQRKVNQIRFGPGWKG